MLWNKQFYYYVVGLAKAIVTVRCRSRVLATETVNGFTYLIMTFSDARQMGISLVCNLGFSFHVITLAMIDPDFKRQLSRLTREWYMHPNGQLPS